MRRYSLGLASAGLHERSKSRLAAEAERLAERDPILGAEALLDRCSLEDQRIDSRMGRDARERVERSTELVRGSGPCA